MGKRIPITGVVHHGLNIIWYRSQNEDLTQERLSELTGISQRDISTYESQQTIDDEILEKFAKAFEIHVRYLRDCICFPSSIAAMYFFDQSQSFKDQAKNEVHHPLDMMKVIFDEAKAELKDAYNESKATIIESHNRFTLYLENRIKELENELKQERNK